MLYFLYRYKKQLHPKHSIKIQNLKYHASRFCLSQPTNLLSASLDLHPLANDHRLQLLYTFLHPRIVLGQTVQQILPFSLTLEDLSCQWFKQFGQFHQFQLLVYSFQLWLLMSAGLDLCGHLAFLCLRVRKLWIVFLVAWMGNAWL